MIDRNMLKYIGVDDRGCVSVISVWKLLVEVCLIVSGIRFERLGE